MNKIVVLLSMLFTLSSAFAFHPPLKFNSNIVDGKSLKRDSGIFGPRYTEQVKILKDIAAQNETATYIHYGDSVKNRPLSGVLFAGDSNVKKLILVTGATHGNEYLNIVDRLAAALLKDEASELSKFVASGGAVMFIPVLNPDGYDARGRSNNNRADLNRDWPNPGNGRAGLKQPESKALAEWVDNYLTTTGAELSVAVDYHCCVRGMLLLPWGYKDNTYMTGNDLAKSIKLQNMFKKAFPINGGVGTPPDLLYSAVGITTDYWFDKYKAVSFTYEGRQNKEQKYLPNHVQWWSSILKSI
jgi:hypothetical protein